MSHKRMYEELVTLEAVAPVTAAATATSSYYRLGEFEELKFDIFVGTTNGGGSPMTAGSTLVCTLMETDGSTPRSLTGQTTATVTCTIAANTNVDVATATAAAVTAGTTLTINGVVYTGVTASMTAAGTREFQVTSNNTNCAENLETAFNANGVEGIEVSRAGATVTFQPETPGEATVTLTASNTTMFALATTRAHAYLSARPEMLTNSEGYHSIAVRTVSAQAFNRRAYVTKGKAKSKPVAQNVAASN